MDEFCDELEADLQEMGVRLGDVFRRGPELTWRRLDVLIRGLPATSRFATKVRDTREVEKPDENAEPTFGPWATVNHQMADLVDAVLNLTVAVIKVNGGELTSEPKPYPRPTVKVRIDESQARRVFDLLEQIRQQHLDAVAASGT